MSTDYDKGYRGEPGVNNSEYQRGQQDASGAYNPPSQPSSYVPLQPAREWDLSGVRRGGAAFAEAWTADADLAVKWTLATMVVFTAIGLGLGFLAANLLQNPGLPLTFAKIFFFFGAAAVYVPLLFVSNLLIKGTARGWLTLLFMGGLVLFLLKTYVFQI